MTPQWYFNQPKPGDKNREPLLGEFFATEAITNAAEALVREGIQNALDAATGGIVRVRIYVSGEAGALASAVDQRCVTLFRKAMTSVPKRGSVGSASPLRLVRPSRTRRNRLTST